MALNCKNAGLIITVPQATYVVTDLTPDQPFNGPDGITALRISPKYGAGVFLASEALNGEQTRRAVASYVDDYFWDYGNDQSVATLLSHFDGPRSAIKGLLVVKAINVDFGYDLLMKFKSSGIEMGGLKAVLCEGAVGLDLVTGQIFEGSTAARYRPARLPDSLAAQAASFAKGQGRCGPDGKMTTLRAFMDLTKT